MTIKLKKISFYLIFIFIFFVLVGCLDTDNPIVDPDDPIIEPEIPIVDPDEPIIEPEIPIVDPDEPIIEPEIPVVDPDDPTPGEIEDITLTGSITLSYTSASFTGNNITIKNNSTYGIIVEITASGTYLIQGTLLQGFIAISKKELEVKLILNGVNITCTNYSPIVCTKKSNVVIELAKNSVNYLTDGTDYIFDYDIEQEPNACISIRKDLEISGSGKLIVNANYNNGIGSKANLLITNGEIQINAINNALKGNDSVVITGGNLILISKDDGIKSDNITDAGLGYINISGGNIEIISDGDGIQSSTYLIIADIEITINSTSAKGLKAETYIIIQSGVYNIDTYDDSIHAENEVTINDGEFILKTSDEGIFASSIYIDKGNFNIVSLSAAIKGNNLIEINDGEFVIITQKDGIKTEKVLASDLGNILINGGDFNITTRNDAIQAVASLIIQNITIIIKTGVGNTALTSTDSSKGLKADIIIIESGNYNINSYDDSIHAREITINGGVIIISSSDDGIHADENLIINNGTIDIKKSYEGLEGLNITINGGYITLIASDDGVNVAGGNDGSANNERPTGKPGTPTTTTGGTLTINGGYVNVNSTGDGLDSNGSIVMTSGIVIVNGPTASQDAPLDFDGSFKITGGILIAMGSSGMAQQPGTSSTQNTVLIKLSSIAVGKLISLKNSAGVEIVTIMTIKTIQSIVISTPNLEKGTYTLSTGGSYSVAANEYNLYTNGIYSGGTTAKTFTISSIATTVN